MRTAAIHKAYAGVWYIHEDGAVERTDVPAPYNQPSGKWHITGAVMLNNFGYIVARFTLADVLTAPNEIPWRWKNGKQRTRLTDNDHGTPRILGGSYGVSKERTT